MVQKLFDGLSGILGSKAQQAPARRGYYKAMSIFDGDAAYDTEAEVYAFPVAGAKRRIWEYTVPAQMAMCWGYGSPQFPANQGYVWFVIANFGAAFDVGVVTLGHEDHNRHRLIVVDEFSDTEAHTGDFSTAITARSTDKNLMHPLPEHPDLPLVGQDSRLVIDYTAVSVDTEDGAGFSIPVTVYD